MNGSASSVDSGILAFHAQQQAGLKENNQMVLNVIISLTEMATSLARDLQAAEHRHQIAMAKLKAELKVS